MNQLVIRNNTVNCPNCYEWHMMYYQMQKNNTRHLIVLCPNKKKKTPQTIFLPYQEIPGLKELPSKSQKYVFLKKELKIIKEENYRQPSLFEIGESSLM